jgi:hypothetical protein
MFMGKRPQLPPRVCIFCERRPLSEEHLFPLWLRKIVPLTGPNKHTALIFNKDYDTDELVEGTMTFAGPPAARQFKIVCTSCNTGWMHELEEAVSPIISPLILGEKRILSEADQSIICKWAALKTIIAEHGDIEQRRTIKPTARHLFFKTKDVDLTWQIAIGRTDYEEQKCTFSHEAGNITQTFYKNKNGSVVNNTQATFFRLGQMMLYVFRAPRPEINYFFLKDFRKNLVQIHPVAQPNLDISLLDPINEDNIVDISLNLKYYFDLMQISRIPPRLTMSSLLYPYH